MTEITKQRRLRIKQRIVAERSHVGLNAAAQESLADFMEHFTPEHFPVEQAVRLRVALELVLRKLNVDQAQGLAIEDEFITTKYADDEDS